MMSSYFLLKYLSVKKNHLYSFLFQLLNKWMYKKSCKDVSFCFETLNINKIWNTNSNDSQKVNGSLHLSEQMTKHSWLLCGPAS